MQATVGHNVIRGLLLGLFYLASSIAAGEEVVSLSSGDIRGSLTENTYQYLGIPYAAAPVGERRWRAPVDIEPWHGVKDALRPGNACSQTGNFFTTVDESSFNKPYGSEDCLYLNVWVPKPVKKTRPLLIFFHGGSGVFGQAYHEVYHGAKLAKQTDAVVITANYRLGVWGSLQSRALQTGDPKEDSGNFFLLDMIKVLDWAKENCAALSCDPNNITVSGQSAGAVYVLALMRSPIAQGKFHRAISFSGVPFTAPYEVGEERADKFIAQLLINDGKAEGKSAAKDIIDEFSDRELHDYLVGKTGAELSLASGRGVLPEVVADGVVISQPKNSGEVTCEVVSRVPLMIGATRDELSTLITTRMYDLDFNRLWPLFNGEPRQSTINQELGLFKGIVRNIMIQYFENKYENKLENCLTAYAKRLPAVYQYEFVWDNFPDPWLTDFGAFHGLDIPFIFGNFVEDDISYMGFAWTRENRAERTIIHSDITTSIKQFIHSENALQGIPLRSGWKSRTNSEYIQYWGTQNER